MPESVYKIIELVGSSSESWEKATEIAISKASETLRELRIAEVVSMDVTIKDGFVLFVLALWITSKIKNWKFSNKSLIFYNFRTI